MSKIFLTLAIIFLIFSSIVIISHKASSTECGGFTPTSEYKIAFFPDYFKNIFSPSASSKINTGSTLHQILGCSTQPTIRYIPADSIILFILCLGLYVYMKSETDKPKDEVKED